MEKLKYKNVCTCPKKQNSTQTTKKCLFKNLVFSGKEKYIYIIIMQIIYIL